MWVNGLICESAAFVFSYSFNSNKYDLFQETFWKIKGCKKSSYS
jgi:hypothetical protein